MKIAILTTDNREQCGHYDLPVPVFGPAPSALLEGFAVLGDEIEVHVISCSKKNMTAPTKISANIWFHQPIVPNIGWGRTAFSGCALAVRQLLRNLKPDIVHGQGSERDCAISAVYSGFPNVLTIHGNMQQIFRMKLMRANYYYWLASTLESHALKLTNGVLCNSIHTRSLVETRTRKTWLVPNPLRAAFFDTKIPPKKNNSIPVFLVVGVIYPLKQPLEILEVMRALFQTGHRFLIRFVGSHSTDNSYGVNFQNLLNEAVQQGYAEYLGLLEETELIQTIDHADALIHFPKEEAFGLVVAEALSRGLKFFGAKVGGIPNITNGVEGAELYENFDSLKQGIASWLESGAAAPKEAAVAMRSRFHPRGVAERHLSIYREVLGK